MTKSRPRCRLYVKLAPLFLLFLATCQIGRAANVPFHLVCSAENDLYRVLKANSVACARYADAGEAIKRAGAGGAVLLLADGYPGETTPVPTKVLDAAAQKQVRLYIEYPTALPGIEIGEQAYTAQGPYNANVERTVVASDFFQPHLQKMRIMMIHDCHYLPVTVENAHLVLTRVEGYDEAVYGLPETVHPLLFQHPSLGNVMVGTTKLSQFVTGRYAPTEVWGPVWQALLRWLAPEAKVGALTWTPTVRPSFGKDETLPKDARRQTIRRGVEWCWKSRLFIDPNWPAEVNPGFDPLPRDFPMGDGTYGLAEAYIGKRIFYTGNQAVSRSLRNDCNGPVAGSLSLAGKIFAEPRYTQTAVKLHDVIYSSEMAVGPQSNPKSPSYGLVLAAPNWSYWHSDNAMSLMGFMISAAIQQTDRWDEDIIRTTLANFRVTGVNGFRPSTLTEADLQTSGWQYYWNSNYIHLCPHMQSGIWCSYLWLYDKTGFEPLLERTKTGIRLMMEAWPNWQLEANRFEQERARMLLPLAWLVRTQDTPEHRAWLDTVARYIISIQDECGAIPQIPGHVVTSNAAYGTGECAIVHQAGDPATDLLYTINFAFPGMQEAAVATGNPAYVASADKMEDFFIRCQTRSEEQPELDGTWYRGFDFAKWDYWGSDGDAGWGIWSTETGWTSGEIISTLAVRELGTSRWDLAQQCTAAQYFDKYRRTMLPDEVLSQAEPLTIEHAALGKRVTLVSAYHQGYHGGGQGALTDGRVARSVPDPRWQGFEGKDLQATIDLGEEMPIAQLATQFAQQIRSGIYLPSEVEYALSTDGQTFNTVACVKNTIAVQTPGPLTDYFIASLPETQARYVRVHAKSLTTIPTDLPGAGLKVWLFASEIIVKQHPTPPPACLDDEIEADKWKVIWNDEFDSTEIDKSKWDYFVLGKFFGGYAVADAAYLDGQGNLVIKTYEKDGKYYSCGIYTDGKFEHRYGYWEARIELPSEEGHSPAFWIHSEKVHPENAAPGEQAVEKDVMEYFPSVGGKGMEHNLHWGGYGDQHQWRGFKVKTPNLTQGFHTYGVLWTPTGYVFYVDRKETWRISDIVSNVPQFVIISNAVGVDGCGDIKKAHLPDFYRVDYVRVYDRLPD